MIETYREFVSAKMLEKSGTGFDVPLESLHDRLFAFQKKITRWALKRGRAAVFAGCGLGKGLLPDTPVLTPAGWKAIGLLKIGDIVIGRDGQGYPVQGVFHRGVQDCYRFTFSDGATVVCDDDHLWAVRNVKDIAQKRPWRVMSTASLRATGLHYGRLQQSRTWRIPLVQPIEFEAKNLPIHPYLMGVLLGDGSLSAGRVSWSTPDAELAQRVIDESMLPDGCHLVAVEAGARCASWNVVSDTVGHGYANPVMVELRNHGLCVKSAEKHVPKEYLFTSISNRVALLNGLMDTDGYSGESPEFSSCSLKLAEAVVFLVQSLGGTARLNCKLEPTYTHNGEKRIGQPSWRVTMTMPPGFNPFSLPRKAAAFKTPSRGLGRWIDSIEPVGQHETVCIAVDAPDKLFVTQQFIVTHNTAIQLEWARHVQAHTQGAVLIYAPLTVARQTEVEGRKQGVVVRQVSDLSEIRGPGIYATNYEKHHRFRGISEVLAGIVLDESSLLKSVDGKTRTELIEEAQGVPFRLCCTATPAPNDITELASHSEFLGVKSRQEMLAHWFVHDADGWRLKGHAARDFYRWMATWSVFLRDPSDIGEPAAGYDLPELIIQAIAVESEAVPDGFLFQTSDLKGVANRAEVRKSTTDDRVEHAAQFIEANPGVPWICWTGLNTESDGLAKRLRHLGDLVVQVEGSTSEADKLDRLQRFIDGRALVLISKPRVCGFGLNLQHCSRQIFVGIGDSFEQYFQAIRRSYRFGQPDPVQVWIVTSNLETSIVENVYRKEEEARRMGDSIIESIGDLEQAALNEGLVVDLPPGHNSTVSGHDWTLHNGDCVEVMAEHIADESVDLSVYSPPFATLYTYSDNPRDMGNCVDHDQFHSQFKYAIDEIFRVTKRGRLTCVHVAQVTTTLTADGVIGLNDFRGAVIEAYKRAGFVHYREVTIDKCPQALRDGTSVLTPTGWQAIETLTVGDYVIGKDGKPTVVLGVWPQGERPLFRVKFADGAEVDCDGDHLWNVAINSQSNKPWQTLKTCEIDTNMPSGHKRWMIPLAEPVHLKPLCDDSELSIDPYTMGVLLGDGCISQDRVVEFCTDVEIAESLPLPARHRVVKRVGGERAGGTVAVYGITCDDWHKNPLMDALREMKLQGKRAEEKFIPQKYLHASFDARKDLLSGLLDTDGTFKVTRAISYSTTSKQLAEDIQFLVFSLGGMARVRHETGNRYLYKEEWRRGRDIYYLNIRLPENINPFRLARKAEKWRPAVKGFRRVIESIKPVESGNCTCITVAASDGLFVVKDFIVTHNSAAIRTRSKALTFQQKNKDRSWSGPALADFILLFRKPGNPDVPIVGGVTNEEWIQWARPVWYGINATDTLNVTDARSPNDERHICPLQTSVIERCVRMWSNPDELVLSPFAGIGSEGYGSILHGRRFVGIELKPEYFRVACKNLRKAEQGRGQQTLFSA